MSVTSKRDAAALKAALSHLRAENASADVRKLLTEEPLANYLRSWVFPQLERLLPKPPK